MTTAYWPDVFYLRYLEHAQKLRRSGIVACDSSALQGGASGIDLYAKSEQLAGPGLRMLKVGFIMALLLLAGREVPAATYYMATDGSDRNSGSATSPLATLAGAGRFLQGGDTLLLKDGTYYGGITVGVSGSSGKPVTIKAENDGGAIVDGQSQRDPLKISSKSYVNVEGIVFRNALYDVVKVSGSSHINLRRLSAYNAGVGNYHIFLVWNSSYVLVEDCAASQTAGSNKAGRYCYLSFNGANHNTFRRNYAKYYHHTGGGGPAAAACDYGGSYDLWENNVFDVSEMDSSSGTELYGIYGAGAYSDTSHNTWKGNVVIGKANGGQRALYAGSADGSSVSNWWLENNLFINFYGGASTESGTNWTVLNNTLVTIADKMTYPYGATYGSASLTAKNNSYLTGARGIYVASGSTAASRYNNFSGVSTLYSGTTTDKTGDKKFSPAYDSATYGKGAYLMVPPALQKQGESGADIGAEVLYQYQDGLPTDVPVWPWPMENRIFEETGVSVTWAAYGGVWKTLDGIYPLAGTTTPLTVDTTAPSTPAGLAGMAASSTQINLFWTTSTDNVGVAGYRVYRNGTQIATTATTTYTDTGLLPSTTYTYGVAAYDAAGNSSAQSGHVFAVTKAISGANTCAATLSSDLILHIPAATLNGAYLWGNAVCNIATDGTILCRVTDYGDANPKDFRNCSAGWISPDLSAMHLPSVLYENQYYWGDLAFVPTVDGSIWLKVAAYGQN